MTIFFKKIAQKNNGIIWLWNEKKIVFLFEANNNFINMNKDPKREVILLDKKYLSVLFTLKTLIWRDKNFFWFFILIFEIKLILIFFFAARLAKLIKLKVAHPF